MEQTQPSLPVGWEERWQRDKEKQRSAMEEGGRRIEEEERKLRWIVAYNSRRMGAKVRSEEDQDSEEDEDDEEQPYHRRSHPSELFLSLEALRGSALLTDLTLSTAAGGALHTHSPVMASVSTLIRQSLQERDREGEATAHTQLPHTHTHTQLPHTHTDTQRPHLHTHTQLPHTELSVCLSGDVEQEGLAAVVEFAYTGAIAGLNPCSASRVRAAAVALGAHRVLQLCTEEEEEGLEGGGREDERKRRVLEVSLDCIRQLWVEQVGCDVELQVEGKTFPAHRVLLAACSEYFRGMFCSGMRESRQDQVELRALEGAGFGELLSCCYTGQLCLGWDSVFEKASTALQLQLHPALPLCLYFLRSHLDARSCLDVAAFAEAYGTHDLQEEADDFLLSRFQEVASAHQIYLTNQTCLSVLMADIIHSPTQGMISHPMPPTQGMISHPMPPTQGMITHPMPPTQGMISHPMPPTQGMISHPMPPTQGMISHPMPPTQGMITHPMPPTQGMISHPMPPTQGMISHPMPPKQGMISHPMPLHRA
ncbi:uncharacterized protein LOC118231072 [Anguilla anguilla]|uniref:uncharacterized protein LOC118231072 n=1 Tax=Anguilla anguilla TaxID=7936 RepID=UPI0015AC604B|nr:uncharacterized protein LOC118231072 [Anguilla anguilla]